MTKVVDWAKYSPYFTEQEFRCKHTGLCEMQEEFMDVLQAIRTEYGKPMRITSGYRHPTHPVEARKRSRTAGEHTMGLCCDVGVSGADAHRLLQIALKHGITRVGVQQKGEGRFLHLGIANDGILPTPMIWSY